MKSVEITPKCPGAIWPNGSGDLKVTNTADEIVWPTIIKKNGQTVNIEATYRQGSDNYFLDMDPATYIIKYNLYQCTTVVYDTVVIPNYIFPTASPDTIYQCAGGYFFLNAIASYGLSPYTYEIIGSTPSAPSIIAPPQSSPFFEIYNGTVYNEVRLRVIDNCGNSAMKNIRVLPLMCDVFDIDSTKKRKHAINSEIKVYPNPSTSTFHIQLDVKSRYLIQIFSVEGIKVLEEKVFNLNKYSVNNRFPPGQYLIRIIDVTSNKNNMQVIKHIIL
jgi:hypothetical protein